MRRRNPVNLERDQRYWRRRANRRVRKARRTVGLLRWSLILLVNGIVATALLLTAERAVDYLTSAEEFAVARIELHGVRLASDERIRSRLESYLKRNILELDLARIEAQLRGDPWVRRATVRRVLPDTLRVHVTERLPMALALIDGRAHLLDTTGYVIGPASAAWSERFPVLTGLAGKNDEALRVALRSGVEVLDRLQQTDTRFAAAVSELDLSREEYVAVSTSDGGPTILLDPRRVELNLLEFLELREAIHRRVGAAEYVDLRWRDRISVMPASKGR